MGKGWVLFMLLTLFGIAPLFVYAAPPCPYSWERNLRVGMTGDDVLKLQEYLSVRNTGYFGPLTKAAVTQFQEQYPADILTPNGLTRGSGFFGASTRAKLNNLCSGQVAGSSVQSNSNLTVTAGDQPAYTIAPANAGYIPFTNFTLTAGDTDVTVSSVTVRRVGPASDQIFYDIVLFDDSWEYDSTVYGFTSAHEATFTKPFVVPARTSKIMTVVGDMNIDLTSQDGQMAGLEVISIRADAPVSGTLPIVGTFQTANASLVIGSVTALLGVDDPRAARTRYITDANITFSSIRITAGSPEDVTMNSIMWRQSGTANPVDLANVRTVVNGVSYPADVDGKYYTSTFPNGILIRRGDSINVSVVGDLTGSGSNRTVQFNLDEGADADFTGMVYGFGIFMLPAGNTDVAGANSAFLTNDGTTAGTSLTPYFAGSITTISPGAFSGVGKSN
jgi:peptidoglycan hydrolase-like protein with peptidoglycan-binding domain